MPEGANAATPSGHESVTATEPEEGDLSALLRATSRTFALGIELLGSPLKEEIRLAYLILRVSDYLEDNTVMAPEEKIPLLLLWHQILRGEASIGQLKERLGGREDPIPDLEAIRHAASIIAAFRTLDRRAQEVICHHAGDSTLGMARWVDRGSDFPAEEDLDDYMHEVAGRVGYLLTDLFALRIPQFREDRDRRMTLAREFGLALQTVNVIRGLGSDRDRGWIFVPRSFIRTPGLSPKLLFNPEHRGDALAVLEQLVTKAERHFEAAVEYTVAIPRRQWRVRLFCLLPLFFGLRTLALSRGNPQVLDGEVKISRRDVRGIARRSMALHPSNAWIRRYAQRLGRGTGAR